MPKKIKPIFEEESKRIRENRREEIWQHLLEQKEKKEIRRTELRLWQKIIVNIVSFFSDSSNLEKRYKKLNYNDNIEKGLTQKPKVLDAEIDRKEFEELRKLREKQALQMNTKTKNANSNLQNLKDASSDKDKALQ